MNVQERKTFELEVVIDCLDGNYRKLDIFTIYVRGNERHLRDKLSSIFQDSNINLFLVDKRTRYLNIGTIILKFCNICLY